MALCFDTLNTCEKWLMTTFKTLEKIILTLPEVTIEPHFEKISFRVKKKIFATYYEKNNRVCLRFSEIDQDIFKSIDESVIYPVPNKWGKQGWTFVQLEKVKKEILKDAMKIAFLEVAPKKLADQIGQKLE